MALIKQKDWKYGLSINYWMIGKQHIDKLCNSTKIEVYGYISKEQRTNNISEYCEVIHQVIDGIGNTLENLYIKLKEDIIDDEGTVLFESFFKNSIDDI